jgi:hypothetical protein
MKPIRLRVEKPRRLPALGRNPAAVTGNASGPHDVAKGKGSQYNRARRKEEERRDEDDDVREARPDDL